MLSGGQVHSADDWHSLLAPVVACYRDADVRRFFRGDAASANPDIYDTQKRAHGGRGQTHMGNVGLDVLLFPALKTAVAEIEKERD